VIGHVLFTRAKVGSAEAALLAPLAVSPEWQRQGVGGALVREALARAARDGFGLALVLGHPAYYPRFGFVPAVPLGVLPLYPVEPSEAWMVAELGPGAVASACGAAPKPCIVRVAEEFMHEELWRE
jgi:putative acetyltransferase